MSLKVFVPTKPNSGELSEYNRADTAFWFTQLPFTWEWSFSDATPGALGWPRVRLIVDGSPATEWVQYTTRRHPFTLDVPDGHHWIGAEIDDPNGVAWEVIEKSFVVNTTGAPLATQVPWTMRSRFEVQYDNFPRGHAQLAYPGTPPAAHRVPLKPRVAEPFATRLPPSELWSRRLSPHDDRSMRRIFVRLPTGDLCLEQDQKYFYFDATSPSLAAVLRLPPRVSLMDGGRGLSTLGYVYKIILDPGGKGMYMSDTVGRICFMSWTGSVTTICGWRNPPGVLKVHSSLRESHPDLWATGIEVVGDWSRIPEPKQFAEPWGMAVKADPGFSTPHVGWVCDTLPNRILFFDHWTAHSPANYFRTPLGPVGYNPPDAPTGKTTMVVWLDRNSPGVTPEMMDEPWDITLSPDGEYLYWTNFKSGTICRARIDGSDPEVVYAPANNPTDADLQIPQRLANSLWNWPKPSIPIRALTADGPFGVSTHFRPQALAFVPGTPDTLLVGHRYEFNLVEYDLIARTSRTFAVIPNVDQWGLNDIALAISDGTFGPLGDVFTDIWNQGKRRWAADGTYLGKWFGVSNNPTGIVTGPLDLTAFPGYSWGIAVGQGRLVSVGSAGGSQFIEVTKRQPSDPTPDVARITRGHRAHTHGSSPSMGLLTGAYGQNALGYPQVDQWGAWDDAALRAFGLAHGIPEASVEDWIVWVRWMCVDNDYATAPPPPPPPKPSAIIAIRAGFTHTLTTAPPGAPVDVDVILKDGATGRVG